MFASLILTFLASASAVLAAPSPSTTTGGKCNVSKVKLTVPSGAPTPLAAPLASGPKFIAVALGVQNYTCGTTGTFTSTGAVAELFDASCLATSAIPLNIVTDLVFAAWKIAPKSLTAQDVIKGLSVIGSPDVLGQHYFIQNPSGSGLSPKWDFTSASEKGHADAFVVGAKTGDILAPTNPTTNVDWLSLSAAQGDLASQIFRMETRGGQPEASCTTGETASIKYASQYWFYGGSF